METQSVLNIAWAITAIVGIPTFLFGIWVTIRNYKRDLE